MDTNPNTVASDAVFPGRWIANIVLAVVLGEAIWGFLISLISNLILPALARVMGEDAQSPLYLGKGDFNVPGLFASVLELCLAGIVAVVLNSWSQRKPRLVRSKSARLTPVSMQPATPATLPAPALIAAPVEVANSQAAANPPQVPATEIQPATPSQPVTPAASKPAPAPPAAKPEKPKPPKEVYYNIVGEPLILDDDE